MADIQSILCKEHFDQTSNRTKLKYFSFKIALNVSCDVFFVVFRLLLIVQTKTVASIFHLAIGAYIYIFCSKTSNYSLQFIVISFGNYLDEKRKFNIRTLI